MRRFLLTSLVVATLFAGARTVQAQDTTDVDVSPVKLVLYDGSELIGTVRLEDSTLVRFETVSGVSMEIPRDRIRRIEALSGQISGGRYRATDPNRTRLFFAPTGRALTRGSGYFALYEIFFPFVSYGIADWASMSGGITLVPGAGGQVLYGAVKLTPYERGGVALSVGSIAATTVGIDDGGSGGLIFGIGTFGSREAAVTAGLAFAFGEGEFDESPVFILGGEVQVSNRVKLVTENYVIPELEGSVILSAGLRFFGDRMAGDFGLFTSPDAFDEGGFPFLPWIGFSVLFGSG
jgi:hypothetical protein